MPVICAPLQHGRVGHAQGHRQPSTLLAVQGVRSFFESPNGRLDADPARTQELVEFSSKYAEAASCVVFGEFAGFKPSADGLAA